MDEDGGTARAPGTLQDKPLAQLCRKDRLLDLIRTFVIFDAGKKKVPRLHQYFGIKAAQERIARRREGGVIWHTQGSGKSILMVLLAKWLLEHDPHGRVLVITDLEELDIKPYEADMRHLIYTYIQAEPADPLGTLEHYSLVQLIIATGIHDAIAKMLDAKGKLSKNAIAEGIINNVRKTIIRDQLTDPKLYEEMSRLLDDLIALKRTITESYEEFLQKAEALVHQVSGKAMTGSHPSALNGNLEAIHLDNNLDSIPADSFQCPADADGRAKHALEIDRTMREKATAGWKGNDTKEKQVINALYENLDRDSKATCAAMSSWASG